MRLPHSWLRELVPEAPDADHCAELLTGIGLAVEAVHHLPAPPAGVVVADVVGCEPVPDSDHLRHVRARVGMREFGVVCGAPNVRVGLRSALALPGTVLPGFDGVVEAREMRGVASEGMLCSPRELGVYDYGGGLLVLGDDAEVGVELAELWPEERVLELEITPNRADAFSVLGVARDLAAKLGVAYRHPAAGLAPGRPDDERYILRVEDDACPRFTVRHLDNLRVAPSPLWLQRRLAALGLRPRNNVVDATNYVTFELGQPSHAYDARVLGDRTIGVRRARAGERLTTLAEEELELHPDDLVIATPDPEAEGDSRALGLAGVIGGLGDSVRADTREVALEVAHFQPVGVRRTAKRHNVSTDAHYRFERGVDPNLPPLASIRCAQLIAELAGGRAAADYSGVGDDLQRPAIDFRPSRVHFLMDFEVPAGEQRRVLEALGCAVESADGTGAAPGAEARWRVTPPSWRFDLAIEEDLVEEVGRMHGYENIGETVPTMFFVPPDRDPTHRRLRTLLAGFGLQEALSYSFTSDEELARAAAPAARVRLQHPQGAERSVLRTRLYPGLLQAAVVNRALPSLALFEIGRVFEDEERERLALLWRGPWTGEGWLEPLPLDFFVCKGLLEKLAGMVRADLAARPAAPPHLHPGVAAELLWNGRPVGHLGRLHPEVAARFELDEVYLAELDLPLEPRPLAFRDVQRQPFAERDLAVIAPTEVTYAELAELVRASAGARLETVWPFDVYAGPPIPDRRRSVALRLRFRHPERSLTDDEVDGFMGNVIAAVRQRGYDIRE